MHSLGGSRRRGARVLSAVVGVGALTAWGCGASAGYHDAHSDGGGIEAVLRELDRAAQDPDPEDPEDPGDPDNEEIDSELAELLSEIEENESGEDPAVPPVTAGDGDPVATGEQPPPEGPDAGGEEATLPPVGGPGIGAGSGAGDPVRENPYREFGSRIVWYRESGFVMKPFSFPPQMGSKAMGLLRDHSGVRVHAAIEGLGADVGLPELEQPADAVVLHLVEGYEREAFASPRGPALSQPQAVRLGDWLLVTAMPEQLRQVERFIETFLSSVRQIEIEAKIVEVVGSRTLDYGVNPIDAATPIFGLPNPGSLINSIDFSFGNAAESSEAIFGTTAIFDGVRFNALLEMVATEENVSIISRPKVAVREGTRADIVNITRVPFLNIPAINANGTFTTSLDYREVGVQLYVVPHVIGDSTVVLNVDIEASQQTGTAVALAQGDQDDAAVILVPEISKRSAHTTVRLEPGQAVILGGLITRRNLERERKVPWLGDVPLLGNLFKSRFSVTEEVNVLFFIRPRILQRSELHQDF